MMDGSCLVKPCGIHLTRIPSTLDMKVERDTVEADLQVVELENTVVEKEIMVVEKENMVVDTVEADLQVVEKENTVVEKENMVVEKKNTVVEKENMVVDTVEADLQVVEKENTVVEKENTVVEKENTVVEKENTVVDTVEADLQVVEKENTVVEKENMVVDTVEADLQVVELENTVVEKENTVVEKENTVVEKENTVVEMETMVMEIETTVVEIGTTVVEMETTELLEKQAELNVCEKRLLRRQEEACDAVQPSGCASSSSSRVPDWNCLVKTCEVRLKRIPNSLLNVGDSESYSDNQCMPPRKTTSGSDSGSGSDSDSGSGSDSSSDSDSGSDSDSDVSDSDSDSDNQCMPPRETTCTMPPKKITCTVPPSKRTFTVPPRKGTRTLPRREGTATTYIIDSESDSDSDSDSDFSPMKRPRTMPPLKINRTMTNSRDSIPNGGEPDSDSDSVTYSREDMIQDVIQKNKKLKDFCLSCGSPWTEVDHPLFEGRLCLKCKDNMVENLYRYDEDGSQAYCSVCCAGQEVILCGTVSCCRCFCKDCVDILVAPETFSKIKEIDPWSCFMCDPTQCHAGHLKLRDDWSIKVQQLFTNETGWAFEPHRVYPSIPAQQRRPLRVLSLFDGISAGCVALKQLGFKIERYVASEVCQYSINVGKVKHDGLIQYVGDVCNITSKQLAEWGPFDLLIGGSPCQDLSTVNPNRKGLYGGTGMLFFEFERILNKLRPREDEDRPFFWLFENVVNMELRTKADICKYLKCNPVLHDAVEVSPAHRARYFWGNVPGMNRDLTTTLEDKVNLQDCLEKGRVASMTKVKTITTKCTFTPVTWNHEADHLWLTEIEQIFGFPKHYTDVNNMGKKERQMVLGRSWSVPVIRHLFAPLKDYYQCEAVPAAHCKCFT